MSNNNNMGVLPIFDCINIIFNTLQLALITGWIILTSDLQLQKNTKETNLFLNPIALKE